MKNKKLQILLGIVLFIISILVEKIFNTIPNWIILSLYIISYVIVAWDIVIKAIRNIFHGQILDENFLMTIASIGAFILGEYSESVAVMLFYQIGEYFQNYAVNRSRKQIASLMDIRPDKANVVRDGTVITVEPDEVNVGEIIEVRNGEKIPVDGIIVEGIGILDTKALTGESLPKDVKAGDYVLSGSINIGSVLRIKTEKEYYDSTVSKILDMVECAAGKKAKSEKFITRFSKYYTPIVVGCAVLIAIIPSIIDGNWSEWISRALTFLVVSCPCALVISVPLSFFGGIGGASKNGILIKGGNALEKIGKANTFVFDKTGTLTKGSFSVTHCYPEEKKEELLKSAYIAESASLHPIAKCICLEAKELYSDIDTSHYKIDEIAGKGIMANGAKKILCGNLSFMKDNNIAVEEINATGSIVYVAIDNEYIGCIVVEDTIKDNAAEVISALHKENCKTIMLTGDAKAAAQKIAERTGIDSYYANLLPTDKAEKLTEILEKKNKDDIVAYTGDGINDAPVIMMADVGISMGGIGSDSAIEAADVVLMYDDLNAIIQVRKISRKTLRIVKENIIFALGIKIAVLILAAFGLANMWLAVFADVGVSVIAILNAMRCYKISNNA